MKKFGLLLLLVLFSIPLVFSVHAKDIQINSAGDLERYISTGAVLKGEHIDKFYTYTTIQKAGSIDVEEMIAYDFAQYSRHGIYRNIPFTKTNLDGKKYELDIVVHRVVDEAGNAYPYTTSRQNEQLSIKIGDPDRTITGKHVYVISYTVGGALTYFSDHDELYWNSNGNEWTIPIGEVRTTVQLPQTIEGPQLKLSCYTGAVGSTESGCTYQTKDNTIVYETKNILGAQEGLTIVVGFPKQIVAVLEPKPYIPFWETWYGRLLSTLLIAIFIVLSALWYVIYPVWIVVKWWRYGRDPQGTKGEARAWYDAPRGKDGKPQTPAQVGALVDETVHQKDISAAIVDLARRGYLRIEERKKNDFYLVKAKEYAQDTSLHDFERKLLDTFVLNNQEIRLKNQHLAVEIEEVKKLIYERLVHEGYFPKNPHSVRVFYYAIGFLALFTLNLPLTLIAFIFGRAMPQKTLRGVEAAAMGRSLKNFLSSQERQLTYQSKNQMMFEKLLPYAIAFGVEKIWADRFKDIALRQPDWYSGYGTTRFNSMVFANSLHNSMNSVAVAATPTRSSSGFSSGGGGGFSGGGGGGGGGGSW